MILIFENTKVELGRVVRTFKALVSKKTGRKQFWQRNYYEHVIRNNDALRAIREYIQNNPAAERIKFEEFYKNRAR
jgi:REP element-mobilizing transposase RayT